MLSPSSFRTLRLAFKSLLLHKLRSGLTMLGIVFGVFSVVAMLAIGEGASSQAQQQVRQLGATNVIIRSVKPPEGGGSSGGERSFVLRYGLTREDYRVLSKTLTNLAGVVPVREVSIEVRHLDNTLAARVVGCTPDYLTMNHLAIARGRFIAEEHVRDASNVAVIGAEAAEMMFPATDPIGRQIQIGGQAYEVIGVTKFRTASAAIGGSLSGQDYNKDVYVPIDTFQLRINVNDLFVKIVSGSFSAESVVYDQITLKVAERDDDRDGVEVLRTAEVVRETLERLHGKKQDYAVIVPLELIKQADQLRWIFNIVLGSIAAISLVVGGIGIMNIMLATVTERTREIGIRRALGARRNDIVSQFLTETVVLSGVGGLIGLVLGLLTGPTFRGVRRLLGSVLEGGAMDSEVGRIFKDMEPEVAIWSLPLAFGFSVAIGVIFGVYPARSAARLDPIEALRHE
ncbi:MAG: ABC transporter permease [Planctomycetaceae bacterium]